MKTQKWELIPPNLNPCAVCNGTGSEWKRRKDGQPDRRFVHPIGPCPTCGGTGENNG